MDEKERSLVDEILEITRPGSVTGWSDRLGELARCGCIRIELINWYQSPKAIATDIVRYAKNNDTLDVLESGIKAYRFEVQ